MSTTPLRKRIGLMPKTVVQLFRMAVEETNCTRRSDQTTFIMSDSCSVLLRVFQMFLGNVEFVRCRNVCAQLRIHQQLAKATRSDHP